MISDFYSALNIVKKVLAADFACEESCFDEEGIFVCEARELPGRRRFPFREKSLTVATMGKGVVISCNAERLRWAKAALGKLSRNDLFYAPAILRMDRYVRRNRQFMAGPELKYVCVADSFVPFNTDKKVEILLFNDAERLEFYNDRRFPNSLNYSSNPRRVAAIARCNGEIAGKAGASADCDFMWQIGIDTLPEYRQRGIGKALVSVLTQYIFEHGLVPYYSTNVSNIASQRIAGSLGYRPAWVELYSQEIHDESSHP
jgi:GNAT superfamily N-acetyltransferase